ncbi:unnamed protein product [Echinostoma caproni]|uniref:USP domain-containing protein n=1 Tax=Echinostoma caproni TaxID=27848 RepID=A0A183AZX7_9TREM|nr:unnamed protein product [Echinostoma caproni]
MFGFLLESQLEYYDPSGFWKSFRPWDTSEAVNPREQQDAFDFFQALIDQLDEELKKLKREPFFQAIYQGIFLDSKFCDECEHRYDREEVFSAINLAVRVHDLQEALNQFVRGEVLDGDNAYYCERCRMKRRTVKRMSVHTLPPVLCLHLKRFDFDWDRQVPIKFSDHFTFPRQLDMSPYMADSVQKLRPEAFFSPSSSTSSLLQREARVGIASMMKKQFHLSDNELSEDVSRGSVSAEQECRELPRTSALPNIQLPDQQLADGVIEQPSFGLDAPSNVHSTVSPLKKAPTSGLLAPTYASTTTQHLYRLVGIIVHSGQANSGHYYAFIKDRGRAEGGTLFKASECRRAKTPRNSNRSSPDATDPTEVSGVLRRTSASPLELGYHSMGMKKQSSLGGSIPSADSRDTTATDPGSDGRWYRFNDTSVEPVELDDALLEHECFGGSYKVSSSDGRSTERRTRYWSAYMLFYERVDLNYAALRQSLMTKRSVPVDESHATRSPIYECSVPSLITDNLLSVSPKSERILDTQLSISLESVTRSFGATQGTLEDELDSQTPSARTDNILSCRMPKRIASQIWSENWAFLRDRNIFSKDYFHAIRGLCEGILLDSSSLRHEPQRGVIGTRLLSHFIFHTFLCLHPRTKLSIEGCLADAQSASSSAVRDMAAQINSEWLELLVRLASTSPKACRWLMHFLYTSPSQPCLAFMLLAPKPATRQQLANTLLTILRTFYSFRETNIVSFLLLFLFYMHSENPSRPILRS